ncbi:hypothetical protein O9K51_00008 [Purpureocillium lavendulum]|uniref:Uncharacterized protein n=1 Tax=Purpureocillium lavendulum TaxID=1247861 RepID=A0AB34G292_9HYPO|nr:hypothetical protein O9K51_00008 [Purpureocillium lavendulum]
MKVSRVLSVVASAAAFGFANAQNIPKKVTILTPQEGTSVGMKGLGWMVDVVAEFSSPSASTSAAATPTSGSSGGGGGYRRSSPTKGPDDGFIPFLNSPNLTSFGPGPGTATPGFVCLLSTGSDPTQNFAGAFQLNAITNSDTKGNILEAYFSWFVGAASFVSKGNTTATVFFLSGDAPAKYTGDPKKDPKVISNIATVTFSIFDGSASNTTSASSISTPLSITLFTPRGGEVVGRNGSGWMVDMAISNNDTKANYFAPSKGYMPLYHDNFTDTNFSSAVVSRAVPGLVVLSNSSTLPGGPSRNLANLFQINAVTGVRNGIVTEYWCTWLVGSPFAGMNQPSSLTIFVVNGTAPTTVGDTMPDDIISNVMTVNFTLAGAVFDSADSNGSKSGAETRAVAIGSILLGAFAFAFQYL